MHKKKHHHEEHEEHVNHEAWVIPYADMLTLLMAMFLVLWAIGQVDITKARQVSQSFGESFGFTNDNGSGGAGVLDGTAAPDKPGPVEVVQPQIDKTMRIAEQQRQQAARETEQQSMAQVEQQIQEGAAAAGLGASVKFRMEGRGLVVSIVSEGVLFEAGSAVIKPAGMVILDGIAQSLVSLPNDLSIEGHTDSIPIATTQFPSNWELSTARASAVLRYLEGRHALPQNRLSAAGYADQRPIATNENAAGRAQNRRVDIAVIAEYPSTDPAGASSTLAQSSEQTDPGAQAGASSEGA